MLVIDASVVVRGLIGSERQMSDFATRLRGHDLAAPAILTAEVVSALRGRVLGGKLRDAAARAALTHLAAMPVKLTTSYRLINRAWGLKDNLTTYDALYVALAEALGAPLLTGDTRLAQAPGIRCDVELVTGP